MAVKRDRKVEFHFFRDVIHVPTYKYNNLWYSYEEILAFANETKEERQKERRKGIEKEIEKQKRVQQQINEEPIKCC